MPAKQQLASGVDFAARIASSSQSASYPIYADTADGRDLAFIVRVLRSRSTTGNAEPELISSRPTLTWRSCGAGGRLQAGTSQGSASRESDALVLRRATLPRATCRGPIPRAISPLGTFGAMRFCKFGLVLRLRRFSWREKYHGIYARVPSISGATPIELR